MPMGTMDSRRVLLALGMGWLAACGNADKAGDGGDAQATLGHCYSQIVKTCVEYSLAKYPDGHWLCSTYSYEQTASCPDGAVDHCTDTDGSTAYYYSEAIASAAAPNCSDQAQGEDP
jgi:hypothetical protein